MEPKMMIRIFAVTTIVFIYFVFSLINNLKAVILFFN